MRWSEGWSEATAKALYCLLRQRATLHSSLRSSPHAYCPLIAAWARKCIARFGIMIVRVQSAWRGQQSRNRHHGEEDGNYTATEPGPSPPISPPSVRLLIRKFEEKVEIGV